MDFDTKEKIKALAVGKHITLEYPDGVLGKTMNDDVNDHMCKWLDELFKHDLVPANLGPHAIFRKI